MAGSRRGDRGRRAAVLLSQVTASPQLVILRESGGSSTPRSFDSIAPSLGYWITRRSLSSGGAKAPTRWRVMTVMGIRKHDSAFSRRDASEVCGDCRPRKSRGRREDRVHAAPAVSCAKGVEKAHTSIQVKRRHPAFPAQWFMDYNALSSVSLALLPPLPARGFASRGRDTSLWGVGTTRFHHPLELRSSVATQTSTASHRAFVTIAIAPLIG
jgi:hypothetical protein